MLPQQPIKGINTKLAIMRGLAHKLGKDGDKLFKQAAATQDPAKITA